MICAGSTAVLRYRISQNHHASRHVRAREHSASIAAVLLLMGIGVGNLTHLHSKTSLSTVLISLGVIAVLYNNVDLWRLANQRTIGSGEMNGTD